MSLSVRALAARQLADYRARTPGTIFAEEDRPHLDLDDAYAVQVEVARLRVAEGEPVAGYKVGATGPGTRKQFGMDGPVRGFVYRTELYPSGTTLSHASYANLAVEDEGAVRLGDDAEIVRIFPVIELHNYVLRSERPTLQELVANSGLHAGAWCSLIRTAPSGAARTLWTGCYESRSTARRSMKVPCRAYPAGRRDLWGG